jgi:N utilization substance protein B
MQALYAFFQGGDTRLDVAERQLKKSFDKMYELYIYQVSFIVEMLVFARYRMEEARKKFFPTEDDLNPNTRFVDNVVVAAIADNARFQRLVENYKINWSEETEMIRRIWMDFRESEAMKQYLAQEESGLKADREILKVLIRDFMAPSEMLRFFFEEKNIHWADDFETMLSLVLKTLKEFKPGSDAFPPELIRTGNVEDDIKEFVQPLFRKTIAKSEDYGKMIAAQAKNWEFDRIAVMDVILMKMAICELIHFPSVPIKVTINEYIEISKQYSTPKSRVFINGMLDKLVETLKVQKLIAKSGRGLLEN